ncbi:MAG: radical SAM protein, partial [Kofleriaceae bacterium]
GPRSFRRPRDRDRNGEIFDAATFPPISRPARQNSTGSSCHQHMLAGAGRRSGHDVRVVDLNALWIRQHLSGEALHEPRRFIGDHDRPSALSVLHSSFTREMGLDRPRETHDDVMMAARCLAGGPFGVWIRDQLSAATEPQLVGLSVMYRDQVEPALAITIVARRLWPNASIIWGGAHVTALCGDIAEDPRYGCSRLISGFVFGYAERTWCDLLDAVRARRLPDEVAKAGNGTWLPALEDGSVEPAFDDLSLYDRARLTIPTQCARGCSYGKCRFCTYPSIEGKWRTLPIEPVRSVVHEAIRRGAAISFKDSLLDLDVLDRAAGMIEGRVPWSACTKLSARLDLDRLKRLADGGLATLEIGLETLDANAQAGIWKKQPEKTFVRFLNSAEVAGIAVIVNYMTGLPHADVLNEELCKAAVEGELAKRPSLVSKLEHNVFQLERRSPMGLAPEHHGIRVTRRLPWSSVMEWESSPRLVPLRRKN